MLWIFCVLDSIFWEEIFCLSDLLWQARHLCEGKRCTSGVSVIYVILFYFPLFNFFDYSLVGRWDGRDSGVLDD